ncbi:hypothetical protein [Luteimonas deserti]|uniref:Uncharacterized protein n=1 Tax=Luteimonas deserti TaxID=2752306 RepID=A0A7Z0U0G7_9GAMM|nr:hypothetical protein [Luteimonas deserti]NYZ63263.1 hypothetical protein [Luteimonas deserti]
MAKINYGFEKRQRELAKQKKQDAKDARKREARAAKAPEQEQDDGIASAPDASEPVPAAADAPDTAAPRVHRRTTPGS